ncbi:Nose resistant to fluoxetine protein 6 [Balamuthia mandrillaris]
MRCSFSPWWSSAVLSACLLAAVCLVGGGAPVVRAQNISSQCIESFLHQDPANLLQLLQGSGKYPGDWGYWDSCKLATNAHYCFAALPVNSSFLAALSSSSSSASPSASSSQSASSSSSSSHLLFAFAEEAALRFRQSLVFSSPSPSPSSPLNAKHHQHGQQDWLSLFDSFAWGPLFAMRSLSASSSSSSSSLQQQQNVELEDEDKDDDDGNNSRFGALSLQWGLCIPEECSQKDVLVLLDLMVKASRGLLLKQGTSALCQPVEEQSLSAGAIVMIILLCLLGALLLVGSALDYFSSSASFSTLVKVTHRYTIINNNDYLEEDEDIKKKEKKATTTTTLTRDWRGALMSWSALYNTRKLLQPSPDPSLSCLNGIRVLSMVWVILGHTISFPLTIPSFDNMQYILNSVQHEWWWQLLIAGPFSVDTFFFVSGFLLGFLCLQEINRSRTKSMNWALFYFHRVWRLSPVYFFLLFVYWKLMPFMGEGPQWVRGEGGDPNCEETWWANLLYIQNLYPAKFGDSCMGWTWYLANDMQFYVLSPLVLFPFYRWVVRLRSGRAFRFGQFVSWSLLAAIFITSLLVNGMLTTHDESPVYLFGTNQTYFELYAKPWIRVMPYVIGLALAFLMSETSILHKARPHPLVASLLQLFAFTIMTVVIFTPYDVYHRSTPGTNGVWTTVQNATFLTINRPIWAFGLAILTFLCASGEGGVMNWLLSREFWTPLARLTYCAYLVHPILMVVHNGSATRPLHLSALDAIYMFLGNFVLSYALAYLFFLLLERPLMNIETTFLLSALKKKAHNNDHEKSSGARSASPSLQQQHYEEAEEERGLLLAVDEEDGSDGDRLKENSFVLEEKS